MTKAEKAKALEYLAEYYKPGDRLYCVLMYVSDSGMSRRVKVLHHSEEGISRISHLIAHALGYRYNRNEGSIVVGGCGTDIACHLPHELSYALWDTAGGCQLRYTWL